MSKTKYNIESQFIEGYNIVDAIDQATFQPQVTLDFNNTDSVDVDLSQSNFFIVDAGLCSGSVANFNFINYSSTAIQRFELLILEPITEEKTFNFENGYKVRFPFKHISDDEDFTEYDYEPMMLHQRRQMLITFRLSKDSSGEVVFIAVPTCWFESIATSVFIYFGTIEMINDRTAGNIFVQIKPSFISEWSGSFDYEKYNYETYTRYGMAVLSVPRIPEYENYDYDYRLIAGNIGAPNRLVKEGVILAEDTRNNERIGLTFLFGQEVGEEDYMAGLDAYTIPTWESPGDMRYSGSSLLYFNKYEQIYKEGNFVYSYWDNEYNLPYEVYGGVFDSNEFPDGWYIFYCNKNDSYNKPPYINMPIPNIIPYRLPSGFYLDWYLYNTTNNSYYALVISEFNDGGLLYSKYDFVKVTTNSPFDPTYPPLPPI